MKLKITLVLLLTLFIKLSVAQEAKSPFDTTMYGRNPAVGKYADIRGFKMYYETYGKGEPLLIIHGNGAIVYLQFIIGVYSANTHCTFKVGIARAMYCASNIKFVIWSSVAYANITWVCYTQPFQ